ncbi:hypothetical protein EI555_009548, partial [Monodon monoceros]
RCHAFLTIPDTRPLYSLGVIGESRKAWLWEAVEVTVEDVEAVAAHLCGHHQILGGAGSSIGPGERAQRSRCGVHPYSLGFLTPQQPAASLGSSGGTQRLFPILNQCLSTPPDPPAPGGHTRPAGPACPLLSPPPGSSPQRCPGTLFPSPGGPAPRPLRSPRGEEARRARRQLEGGRPGGHGGGGSDADRVSHLSSWPRRSRGRRNLSRSASSSCFMEPCTWVGAPERSGPRAGQTRGADGAGPRRPAGGGRRRKRRGGGSGRKELLKVFPGAAGGLSRAGTRVFRYPSSHRRQ